MSKRLVAWFVPATFVALLVSLIGAPVVRAQQPVVNLILFYSADCSSCQEIKDQFLPTLTAKYGDQFQVTYREISDPAVFQQMLAFETQFQVPADKADIPELYIGDHALTGKDQIEAELPGLVEQYLQLGGVDLPAVAAKPVVRFVLFYGESCPHCHEVMDNYLPQVFQKYGDQLEHKYIEVWSNPDAYRQMQDLEAKLLVPEQERGLVPTLVIGEHVLIGSADIPAKLEALIDQYLAQGGVDYPSLDGLTLPTPTSGATAEPGKLVQIAYFFKAGCQECDRVSYDLNYLEQTNSQVRVVKFDILENQALAEWMGEKLKVPAAQRLESPAIYVGSTHLFGSKVTLGNLQTAVQQVSASGTDAIWEQFDAQAQEQATQSIVERFKSLGVLTVVGAGLINGLNPCAFVTIVFFLSYLAFMGRRGREVLLVGGLFTLGVFLVYLLAGLVLNRVLTSISGLQSQFRVWFFGITAVLCLALAGISLYDYFKARQGKLSDMKLKLSPDLRKNVINRVIREGSRMRAFYAVAFAVGALVSLVQLSCTSPIYAGTLLVIHDVPAMRSNALIYLLIYNVAYIVPLVAIFLVAYFGTTSEQLGTFITKRTAAIKLMTVVVFLVLAGWLVYEFIGPMLKLIGVA